MKIDAETPKDALETLKKAVMRTHDIDIALEEAMGDEEPLTFRFVIRTLNDIEYEPIDLIEDPKDKQIATIRAALVDPKFKDALELRTNLPPGLLLRLYEEIVNINFTVFLPEKNTEDS